MDYKEIIIKISNDILENKVGIIEGARKLSKFQFGYNLENNESLLFFVGINSETDNLPVGQEREKWKLSALSEKDKEIDKKDLGYEYGSQIGKYVRDVIIIGNPFRYNNLYKNFSSNNSLDGSSSIGKIGSSFNVGKMDNK